MWKSITRLLPLAVLAFTAMSTLAADKYWKGGSGDWDTTTANWSLTSGGTVEELWVDGDKAIIDVAGGGTIELAADINISYLHIATNDYTITSNSLIFAASGVISNNGSRLVLECGVSGRPDVYMIYALGTGDRCHFAPVEDPMLIGTLYRYTDSYMRYNGSATGSSIAEIADLTGSWIGNGKNNKNDMYGTADWSVGNAWFGSMTLESGTLVVTGEVYMGWQDLVVKSGSILHLNHAGAIEQDGKLNLQGGTLDNSSGGAITTSTYNPDFDLFGDTTFIGSLGANSDLNMGTGTATMNADRVITVSNVAATLTLAGPVDSSGYAYSLTKDGEGTLKLTGVNTYLGETIVSEGTLSITQTNSLSDLSFVRIAEGAVLSLDYSGTDKVLGVYTNGTQGPIGTWGRVGSGADNETALITGDGILNAPAPSAVDGFRWWDGGGADIVAVGNQLSDGNGGTWSTSIKNWDAGAGVAHTNWNNATNDTALLRGGGGTITLAENIHMGDLLIDSDGYTITGNVLDFASGSSISNNGNNTMISAGVTGSPDVLCAAGGNQIFSLGPNAASMTLGTIIRLQDNYIYLRGTATGNTVVAMPYPTASGFYQQNVKVRKYDSGTWTVNGELYGGEVRVYAGTLICNGKLWENKWEIEINGGTLIANGTMEDTLDFNGGILGGTGAVDCAVDVEVAATLAPGYPTGTMTITNNGCTISGTLAIEIDSGESPDHSALDVDGILEISAGTSTLDINVTGYVGGDLVIATYNSLNGKFAATNGLPDGATVDYTYNSNTAIALIVPYKAGTVFVFE